MWDQHNFFLLFWNHVVYVYMTYTSQMQILYLWVFDCFAIFNLANRLFDEICQNEDELNKIWFFICNATMKIQKKRFFVKCLHTYFYSLSKRNVALNVANQLNCYIVFSFDDCTFLLWHKNLYYWIIAIWNENKQFEIWFMFDVKKNESFLFYKF